MALKRSLCSKLRLILLTGWLLVSGLLWAHPYHQSLLELEIDSTGTQLQGALKLLPEDIESIEKFTRIADYLQKSLRIKLDGKALPMTVEGTDRSPKANWVFLSWPLSSVNCAAAHKLTISNHLLFEVNDHFVNTVVWREGSGKNRQPKAHNLTPDQPSFSLNLVTLLPACVDEKHPAAGKQ